MTTKRREATRDRLVAAGRELVAEVGIQAASVEAICERAGFTRGAFYSNYRSKDELVREILEREKQRIVELMEAVVDAAPREGEDGVQAVLRAAESFLAAYPSDRTSFLVHLEFVTHGVRERAVADIHRELWQQTCGEIMSVLERGVTLLGGRLVLSVEQAAVALMGAYEVAMRDALLESDADEADVTQLQELIGAMLGAFVVA
ncbi:MAG: TetR/AcrR family transcriptional regulator [Aeromicrobium sp.]|uniref:TetR/AcrR family transcriptional regulator n=1 Tax=Aeromicrobium sp. TaxID=1871063 RepID=UPI0039E50534